MNLLSAQKHFLKNLKRYWKRENISLIGKRCTSIRYEDNGTICLGIEDGEVISQKVIVAAGSQSGELLKEFPMQKMLQSGCCA